MSTVNGQEVMGNGSREHLRGNVWRIRHNLGYDADAGKYRYSPWMTVHLTDDEDRTKRTRERALDRYANDYKHDLNEGNAASSLSKTTTVADYIYEYHQNRKGTIKPLGYEREGLLVREAGDLLGRVSLDKLTPRQLDKLYATARERGRLSDSELFMVHSLIRRALNRAVAYDIIRKNPAALVENAPRPDYKHRRALTAEEATRFKAALLAEKPCPHVVATLLLLETGCRRGEVLGLTWENVSFESRRIRICQQLTSDGAITSPKSKMSNRQVAMSDETVRYLSAWKETQSAELASKHLKQTDETFVAHALQDQKVFDEDSNPVLDDQDHPLLYLRAGHIDPHNFNRWFRDFCADNGFGTYTRNLTE